MTYDLEQCGAKLTALQGGRPSIPTIPFSTSSLPFPPAAILFALDD